LQTGLQAEALLCPNCKEEVPKTLYCLNCGYPLYKIEVESEPVVEEDAPEPVAIVEAEAVEEEVAPEPQAPIEPEVIQEEIVEITPVPQAPIEPEVVQEEIVEIAPEPLAPIVVVEEEAMEIVLEPVAVIEAEPVEEDVVVLIDSVEEIEAPVEEIFEPVVEEIIDFEPEMEPVADVNAEAEDAVEIEAPVAEAIVIAEEPEPEPVEAEETFAPMVEAEPEVVPVPEYAPAPVIKEVMENLAKNISMKIRLVDLLRTGGVKTEIFRKLFDSYLTRGELLMNSRSEMLERVRYDLGSMERALHEAKEGLEELEIRRTIDDVSEAEYAAKAPGFQWDIGQYKDEVGKKQAEIYYLEDITRVMSSEEIGELVGLGEGCFEVLDELAESEGIEGDAAAKIRVSLEEALACIR